jgi:hypothetical protein
MAHRTTRKKYSSTTTISREDHELGQTTPWLRGRLRSKKFRLLAKQFIRTIRRKYFDYFTFNIVDCGVNCGLIRSGARRRGLVQTIGNVQGLDINSPRSAEITLQTCDFDDISNTAITITLGGSTTTSSPIVVVILRHQLDYVCDYLNYFVFNFVAYGRVYAAPDKS